MMPFWRRSALLMLPLWDFRDYALTSPRNPRGPQALRRTLRYTASGANHLSFARFLLCLGANSLKPTLAHRLWRLARLAPSASPIPPRRTALVKACSL